MQSVFFRLCGWLILWPLGACDLLPISECVGNPTAHGCTADITVTTPRLNRRGDDLIMHFTHPDDTKLLMQLQPSVSITVRQGDTIATPAKMATYDQSGNISVQLSAADFMATHGGPASADLTIRGGTVSAPFALYTMPVLTERTGAQKTIQCLKAPSTQVRCWVGLQRVDGKINLVFAEGTAQTGATSLAFTGYTVQGSQLIKGSVLAGNFDFTDGTKYFINATAFFLYGQNSLSYRTAKITDTPLAQTPLSPAPDPFSGLVSVVTSSGLFIYPNLPNATVPTMKNVFDATLLTTGDLDGDSLPDVVALTQSGMSVFVGPQMPQGDFILTSFTNQIRIQYPFNHNESITALAIGDIDQDQHPDLIFTTKDGLFFSPTIDKNQLGLALPTQLVPDGPVTALYWIDIDGDAKNELILVTDKTLRIFDNLGN